MLDIIPAILTSDPRELEEKVKLVEGLVKRVQIDIVDGVFANNKTVGLEVLEGLEVGPALDVHLMVKEPVDWVEKSIRAMAHLRPPNGLRRGEADRIIGQVEMMNDQAEFVGKVQETGHQVGLALDLDTPVSTIEPELLTNLDVVLVMSVKAGFGGQGFQEQALEKVTELLSYRVNKDYKYRICVDGGVEIENIKSVADAAADEVVIGSSLFTGSLEENYRRLQNAL